MWNGRDVNISHQKNKRYSLTHQLVMSSVVDRNGYEMSFSKTKTQCLNLIDMCCAVVQTCLKLEKNFFSSNECHYSCHLDTRYSRFDDIDDIFLELKLLLQSRQHCLQRFKTKH